MDDIPPINELELAAKKLVWTAQKEEKLKDFTPRLIRQAIEKQFNLEEGSLDASEYKSAIKSATNYAIHNAADEDEDEESKANPKPKNKRKSDGTIKANESPPKPSPKAKGKAKAKAKAIASEGEGSDAETPKKKRKAMPKVKKVASDDEEEDDYKDEDASPKKKPKTAKSKAKKVVFEDEDEEEAPKTSSAKPRTKQGKDLKPYKSAEHVPTSDMEQDEPDTVEVDKAIEINKQPTSPTSPKYAVPAKAQPEPSKSADVDMEDAAAKSESELSVLIDEPPKRKRKKSNTGEKASTKATDKSKPKRTAKSSVALSKDEETIKRLKSLVVACGMRKVWSKVFQGLGTPQQQIKKLKEILADLGMSGRMSMEQAKAIKEKRELEQELADVQEFAEKMEGRASKSLDKAKLSAKIEDSKSEGNDSSEDGEEVEAPKRRPMTARKSIMAFLGDQSDEE